MMTITETSFAGDETHFARDVFATDFGTRDSRGRRCGCYVSIGHDDDGTFSVHFSSTRDGVRFGPGSTRGRGFAYDDALALARKILAAKYAAAQRGAK